MVSKKLIAFTVSGFIGIAEAQTSITIYGNVNTGFVKETGSRMRLDESEANVIGIKGKEELGGNLQATFQLERQFQLSDGTNKNTYSLDDSISKALGNRDPVDWTGAANAGLEGQWGNIRVGRVNEMSVEYYTEIDPFLQAATGSSLSRYNLLRSEQLSNTIRYDSPEWSGFNFGVTYTQGSNNHNKPIGVDSSIYNNGFAGSLRYNNGSILLTANYNQQADSNRSYVWNAGGAYTFGSNRISLGYQASHLKDIVSLHLENVAISPMKQKEWLLGFQHKTGAGIINVSYNYAKIDSTDHDGGVNKYALGYTYNLSRRTTLYGVISYTDSDNVFVGSIYNDNGVERDSVTGIQLGITHNF